MFQRRSFPDVPHEHDFGGAIGKLPVMQSPQLIRLHVFDDDRIELEGRIVSLQDLEAELKYAHQRETGLAVRTAWAHGAVRLIRPAASILEHREVLLGPAVAKLHAALSRRHRGWRPQPEPAAERPDLTSREGEVADMTFVFLRLCHGEAWARLEPRRLDDALALIAMIIVLRLGNTFSINTSLSICLIKLAQWSSTSLYSTSSGSGAAI